MTLFFTRRPAGEGVRGRCLSTADEHLLVVVKIEVIGISRSQVFVESNDGCHLAGIVDKRERAAKI